MADFAFNAWFFGGLYLKYIPNGTTITSLSKHLSVSMVFCGPHIRVAFHFVCGPGKVSFYLVAPPPAAAVYSIKSSLCQRTTLRNNCHPWGTITCISDYLAGFRGFCSPISEDNISVGNHPKMSEKTVPFLCKDKCSQIKDWYRNEQLKDWYRNEQLQGLKSSQKSR